MQMKDVFELIDKMEKSSLTELSLKKEDFEIELKKTSDNHVVYAAPAPVQHHVAAPAVNAHANSAPSAPAAQEKNSNFEIIKSPIVGSFYRSPSPDSPPFVENGSSIKKDQTICIIEAMKMMNELEAEFDCKIEKILVENGTMVEYGTPLFEVSK